MNPMVLCYNLQPEKLGRMRVLALRLGIGVRVVEPDKFGLPVGALAGVVAMPETVEETEDRKSVV